MGCIRCTAFCSAPADNLAVYWGTRLSFGSCPDYADDELCVLGHYFLKVVTPHDFGNAHCIDYAVAQRWKERQADHFDGTFQGKLAALRIPEPTVLFDDGGTNTGNGGDDGF